MAEMLPIYITKDTHPYAIRLAQAYRPFKELYIDTELCSDDIKNKTHLSIKDLTKDIGLEYNDEIKKRS